MLVLTSFAVTLDELSAETSQVLLEEHAASASEQTSVAANATSSTVRMNFDLVMVTSKYNDSE